MALSFNRSFSSFPSNQFAVMQLLFLLVFFVAAALESVSASNGHHVQPAVHFTLARRDGAFAPNRTANLDYLLEQLAAAEARFNLTQREVHGNRVVRAPKSGAAGGPESSKLIGDIGRKGNWLAMLQLGASKQHVETDIDMLTSDFAIISTSSTLGTRFDELFSDSYVSSHEVPFPNCALPRDNVLLPTRHEQFPLTFPHCKPSKQSLDTLHPSGGILGLAPSDSLRQIRASPFISQLLNGKIISEEVFSLTLINGYEGLLSIGGTAAESMAYIQDRIERFLGRSSPALGAEQVMDSESDAGAATPVGKAGKVGVNNAQPRPESQDESIGGGDSQDPKPETKDKRSLLRRGLEGMSTSLVKRVRKPKPLEQKALPGWRDEWKWSPVEGAEGWWQTLMRGVWTDGVKILKNQPCIIDINTPFVLAPPQATKQFYASISGSRRLPPPYSSFYAFPCNNPPFVHIEFGGWRFPAMRGMKSYDSSNGPNGKFSLGKVTDEGGYCVGAVVETRMGVGDQSPVKKGHSRKEDNMRGLGALESGMLAGNGMRDVWVLGEPIFRGLGIVFDMKAKAVGFRTF